jgi:hypothetical protein
MEHPTLLRQVNQRQQLKNEIILDLDTHKPSMYYELIQRLQQDKYRFYAYETKNNRAQHIHLFFTNLAHLTPYKRREVRLKLITKYGCDKNMSTDSHMIPIEGCKHWKTSEYKRLVYAVDGVNTI